MAIKAHSTPGIYRSEEDQSEILVPTGINAGGIVINSIRGPINRPVLVQNDSDFINTFGAPYFVSGVNAGISTLPGFFAEYGVGSYAALEYLKESSVLYVVRNINSGDKYASIEVSADQTTSASGYIATSGGIAASVTVVPDKADRIQNLDTYNQNTQVNPLLVAALYPGLDGNNIAVTVEVFSSSADWINSYDNYTSATATSAHPIASQVFKLNVYYKGTNQNWTDFETLSADSTNGRVRISPIETFYGSLVPLQDENKNQLFIESLVNGNSKYIYVKVKTGSTFTVPITNYNYLPVQKDSNGIFFVNYTKLMQLSNGAISIPTNAGFDSSQIPAWDLFLNRENVNVGVLIAPTYDTATKQEVARIAATRTDCIAICQTGDPSKETVTDVLNSEQYGYVDPSYIGLYCGWSKTYDKYNDRFIYLPNAIYGAEVLAHTLSVANPWDAPAGVTRGTLQVFDQRRVWSFDEIGQLYDRNINSVRFIPGTGFVMWGQKTAQLKHSALDRINVRENLLYIENNVESNLNQFLFENNDQRTRSRVFSLIDPFMSGIKSAGGLYDYFVQVDENNNTQEIIDANQMNVYLFVQPEKSSEFLNLKTIITRTGVSFSTVAVA